MKGSSVQKDTRLNLSSSVSPGALQTVRQCLCGREAAGHAEQGGFKSILA